MLKTSGIIKFKNFVNMEHLIFGNDLDDNFYDSLTSEKFHKSELEQKFKFFYREYDNFRDLPNFIIFNNSDYSDLIPMNKDYMKVFKNNFFTVMKKI